MKSSSTRRRAALGVGVVLAAGWAGSVATASVPPPEETVVLRLATIDAVNGNGQAYGPEAFVNNLDSVSGGQIRVEVLTDYGAGDAEAESQIVADIAAGEIDGGWPTVRAFANAGITGLEAVEAPMTITSYEAEKELVSGPVAGTVLSRLDGTGVVGLSLAVGPLRRPFAGGDPLLGPEDWQGARFRAYNSPVQADTITALGGEPVNIGFGWLDEVAAGNLRGAEFDIAQYYNNGHTTEAGLVTSNVVLWPKVYVLSISSDTFEGLTDEQQGWVREAAEQASQASVEATYDETTLARELCETGTRFIPASAEQLDALHAAVAPVIDSLAADPDNADLLADIQAIAAQHPDPDVPDVPDNCKQLTASTPDNEPIPDQTSDLPDGVYRVEISQDDVTAAGQSNAIGSTGTWTMTVDNGTYQISCSLLDMPGTDCGTSQGGIVEAGYLRGTGNTVWFVYDVAMISELQGCQLPGSSEPGSTCFDAALDYHVDWSLDGDTLTFTNYGPGLWGSTWVIKPWTRIESTESTIGGETSAPDTATLAAFPEGVYLAASPTGEVVTMTYGDGVWRRILEDGTVDCVSTYTVEDGRIWLTTSTDVTLACGWPPETPFFDAAWTFEGDQLRLTNINSDPPAVREFGLPWTRVAVDSDDEIEPGAFPEGAYRITDDSTLVTEVIMDGVVSGYVDGGRFDCGGDYTIDEDRIVVTTPPEPGMGCGNPPNFVFLDATWTFDGNQLLFTDILPPGTDPWFSRPRVRIAVGNDAATESVSSSTLT